jgi:hypothetical protein
VAFCSFGHRWFSIAFVKLDQAKITEARDWLAKLRFGESLRDSDGVFLVVRKFAGSPRNILFRRLSVVRQ